MFDEERKTVTGRLFLIQFALWIVTGLWFVPATILKTEALFMAMSTFAMTAFVVAIVAMIAGLFEMAFLLWRLYREGGFAAMREATGAAET